MSAVIFAWCQELNLSRPLSTLERDFRNGYLLGEVLHKYNQLDTFPSRFSDGEHAAVVCQNYTLLEPAMARLGVPLRARHVQALLGAKEGFVQRLLYELKGKLSHMEHLIIGRPKTEGGKALVQLFSKPVKKAYETETNNLFEMALQNVLPNDKQHRMQEALLKFSETAIANHFAGVAEYEAEMESMTKAFHEDRRRYARASLYQTMQRHADKDREGAEAWTRNTMIRQAEDRQQRFLSARESEIMSKRRDDARRVSSAEFDDGVGEFCAIAGVRGVQADPRREALEAQRVTLPPTTQTLRRDEFYSEMTSRLGQAGVSEHSDFRTSGDAAAVIHGRLRRRKAAEVESAGVRSRRRQAALAGSVDAIERSLGEQRTAQLSSMLTTPSIPEMALMASVSTVLRSERAFLARKAAYEQAVANNRLVVNEAELSRHRMLLAANRASVGEGVRLASLALRKATLAVAAAKAKDAAALASRIMARSVEFAVEVSHQRELARGRTGAAHGCLMNLATMSVGPHEGQNDSAGVPDFLPEEALDTRMGAGLGLEGLGGALSARLAGVLDLRTSTLRDMEVLLSTSVQRIPSALAETRVLGLNITAREVLSGLPIALAVPDVRTSLYRPRLSHLDVDAIALALSPAAVQAQAAPTETAPAAAPAGKGAAAPAAALPPSHPQPHVTALPPSLDTLAGLGMRALVEEGEGEEPKATLAMVPAAGLRLHPAAVQDLELAILADAAQALLDGCALRDYMHNIGAWVAPDMRSAGLSGRILDGMESFVMRACMEASSKDITGLPSILPASFGRAPPSMAEDSHAEGAAHTGSRPASRPISAAAAKGTAAAGAKSGPGAVVPPKPVEPVVETTEQAVAVQTVADELDLPTRVLRLGQVYSSQRDVDVAAALAHAAHAYAEEQHAHANAHAEEGHAVGPVTAAALLGNPFSQLALAGEPSVACDILGLVVREVERLAAAEAQAAPDRPAPSLTMPTAGGSVLALHPTGVPAFPVTLACLGPPHTGKVMVARLAADELNVAVIHPLALMQRAVALAWPTSSAYARARAREEGWGAQDEGEHDVTGDRSVGAGRAARPPSASRSRTPPRAIPVGQRTSDGGSGSGAHTRVPPNLIASVPANEPLFSTPAMEARLRALGERILDAAHTSAAGGLSVDWARVPDAMQVALVVDCIQTLATGGSPPRGWMLVDFPCSLAQARALEEAVTGYASSDDCPCDGPAGSGAALPLVTAGQVEKAAAIVLGQGAAVEERLPTHGNVPPTGPAYDVGAPIEGSLATSTLAFQAQNGCWSHTLAPAPLPCGLETAASLFNVSWPHAIRAVLRFDAPLDRVTRRALGWRMAAQGVSSSLASAQWTMLGAQAGTAQPWLAGTGRADGAAPPVRPDPGTGIDLTGTEMAGNVAALLAAEIHAGMPQSASDPGSGGAVTSLDCPLADVLHAAGLCLPWPSNSAPAEPPRPAIYHMDTAPPEHTHDHVDAFVPVLAADAFFRPGLDGCTPIWADVDVRDASAAIADAYGAWTSELPGLNSWFGRGGVLRPVRVFTSTRGPFAPIHPSLPVPGFVPLVGSHSQGGGTLPTLDSAYTAVTSGSAAQPEEEEGALGGFGYGSIAAIDDMTAVGPTSHTEGALAPVGSLSQEADSELMGSSVVEDAGTGSVEGGTSQGFDGMAEEEGDGIVEDDAEEEQAVGPGGYSALRHGNLNQAELLARFLHATRRALKEQEQAEVARKTARAACEAAAAAEAAAVSVRAEFARKLRSGMHVAAAEAVFAAFEAEHASSAAAADAPGGAAGFVGVDEPAAEGCGSVPSLPSRPSVSVVHAPALPLSCPEGLDMSLADAAPSTASSLLTRAVRIRPTTGRLAPPSLGADAIPLARAWTSAVTDFACDGSAAVRTMRTLDAATAVRLASVRDRFSEVLSRPAPEFQLLLAHYQGHHNDLGLGLADISSSAPTSPTLVSEADSAVRRDEDVQGELTLRLDETVSSLWDAVDARETECLTRLAALQRDGWTEACTGAVAASYALLLRAELKRFRASHSLLCEYYSVAEGAAAGDLMGRAGQAAAEAAIAVAEAAAREAETSATSKADSKKPAALAPPKSADKGKVPAAAAPGAKQAQVAPAKGAKVADPVPPPPAPPIPFDPLDEASLLSAGEGAAASALIAQALEDLPVSLHVCIPPVDGTLPEAPSPEALAAALAAAADAAVGAQTPADEGKDAKSKSRATSAAKPAGKPAAPAPGAKAAPAAAGKAKGSKADAGGGGVGAVEAPSEVDAAPVERVNSESKPPANPALAALYIPLAGLARALRKGMAAADAVQAQVEALVVYQASARAKRVAGDRRALAAAIARVRAEEVEAAKAVTEAAAAWLAGEHAKVEAAKADATVVGAKGAKADPKAGAAAPAKAGAAKPASAKPVAPSSSSRPASGVATDRRSSVIAADPELIVPAVPAPSAVFHIPSPKPVTDIIGATIPSLPTPSVPFLEESLFLALRHEASSFRARLAALLRHATVHVARVQAQAGACWAELHAEVMRTSLAEGACVEAFAATARAAIEAGRSLDHPLRIEVAGDAPVFMVDASVTLPHASRASHDGAAPAEYSGVLERGDLDSAPQSLHHAALLKLLTPTQVSLVSRAVMEAALAGATEVESEYGQEALAGLAVGSPASSPSPLSLSDTATDLRVPPPVITLHSFIDVLARCGASGALPGAWEEAALQAAAGSASLLHDLGAEYTAAHVSMDEPGSAVPLVDWRRFVLAACLSGDPAPEENDEAARAAFAVPGSVTVLPRQVGVANTIALSPSAEWLEELYRTFAVASGAPQLHANMSSGNFPSLLVRGSALASTVWWFQSQARGHGGRTEASAGWALAHAESGSGWPHVVAPHPSSSSVLAEVSSVMASTEESVYAFKLAEAGKKVDSYVNRSREAGEEVMKSVILGSYAAPAGSILRDPSALRNSGLRASDPIVDLGALCTGLAAWARA